MIKLLRLCLRRRKDRAQTEGLSQADIDEMRRQVLLAIQMRQKLEELGPEASAAYPGCRGPQWIDFSNGERQCVSHPLREQGERNGL